MKNHAASLHHVAERPEVERFQGPLRPSTAPTVCGDEDAIYEKDIYLDASVAEPQCIEQGHPILVVVVRIGRQRRPLRARYLSADRRDRGAYEEEGNS